MLMQLLQAAPGWHCQCCWYTCSCSGLQPQTSRGSEHIPQDKDVTMVRYKAAHLGRSSERYLNSCRAMEDTEFGLGL